MRPHAGTLLDAFCVDTEEWFHICALETEYADPSTWERAPARVEQDTDVILELLAEAGVKGTFPTLGWIAERYPALVRRIADAGHEVGCHGYHHHLVYEQTPAAFRAETERARKLLQDVSGQAVTTYRAPGFSITPESYWAFPILAELGFRVDTSIVPAARAHGGAPDLGRDAFLLRTPAGPLTVFPMSVMHVAGRVVPFSGGGYLRLFPLAMVRMGFTQNHRQQRPVMTYIHPREIDPGQPRLPMPALRAFKYYVGLAGCQAKLRRLLATYAFGTVPAVLAAHPPRETWDYTDGRLTRLAT